MAEQDQYRNPRGEEGRKVVRKMMEHHKELLSWTMSNFAVSRPRRVLDVGCGGGACLHTLLLRYPNCHADGVDISEDALAVAGETCRMMVKWGRLTLTKASVESLPFEDSAFQLVTAVETYFFWPDLDRCLKECVRVLSPGGTLVIASEQYFNGTNDADLKQKCQEYGMTLVGNDDMARRLKALGLEVETTVDEDRNWVVFVAKKPRPPGGPPGPSENRLVPFSRGPRRNR